MSYADTERANGNLSDAPAGSKCQGNTHRHETTFTCGRDNGQAADAVHTWHGRNYCGFHSPFDVVEPVRKAHHTDTPGPVLVYWPMSQVRRSVSMWETHLRDVTTYGVAGPLTEEEHAEYLLYVSEGIGDTDGYYAPLGREAWKVWAHPCRKVKVADADAYGRMLRAGQVTTLYGAGV